MQWKSPRGRQSAAGRRGNCGGNSRVAPGQVTAAKAQDLLTRCLSHGCKNDSRSPHSAAASALSTEGNNLGAVSLHCVLLFPPESEAATLLSGRKMMLSCAPPHPSHLQPHLPQTRCLHLHFLGISLVLTARKQTQENFKPLIRAKREVINVQLFFSPGVTKSICILHTHQHKLGTFSW